MAASAARMRSLGDCASLGEEGNADARGQLYPLTVDRDVLPRRCDDAVEQDIEVRGRAVPRDEDADLVTAEPTHGVGGPDALHDALADHLQGHVARLVPVLVVDLLEPVQVDPGERKLGFRSWPRGPRHWSASGRSGLG